MAGSSPAMTIESGASTKARQYGRHGEGSMSWRQQRSTRRSAGAARLVGHDQRLLAALILRRDAGRAMIGMAALRLDAADREHESPRRIRPVGAERHDAREIEGGEQLAARAELDLVADIEAD